MYGGAFDDGHAQDEQILQTINAMHQKGQLPSPYEPTVYTVYRLKQSGYAATESIAFTVNEKQYLAIGLALDSDNKVAPRVTAFDGSNRNPQLTKCGQITASALDLVQKAKDTLRRFGGYSKLCNNCQNFCNEYLRELKINHHKMTDTEKATFWGAVGFGAVAVLYGMASAFGGSSDNDNDKHRKARQNGKSGR